MRLLAIAALATVLSAESFAPNDVAILGDLDYGKTSDKLECTGKSAYCALLFNGAGGDQVTVTLTGPQEKPFVVVADGALKELTRGAGKADLKLPGGPDDLATYYIVFRPEAGKAGPFTVSLSKGK